MIIHDVKCKECGKKSSEISRYCIHCFAPMPLHKPKPSMLHEALSFMAVLMIIAIAVFVGNFIYYIFK